MTSLEPKTSLRGTTVAGSTPTVASHRSAQPRSLMEAVQAAVRDINAQNLRRVAPADAGIAFEPKTLLALLTYCYARRIYSSEDVEAVLRKDCGFRELCRNEFPGADLLRRFRRQNHESLQHCLQETLRFSHPVSSSDLAHSSDAHLAEEADTRIMTAVLMDAPE